MASKYNVHEVKNNRFPDEETHYSITGNDIQMKRICFKPAPELRNRVESLARFEKYHPLVKRKK